MLIITVIIIQKSSEEENIIRLYLKHFLSEDELKHGIAEFMARKLKNLPVSIIYIGGCMLVIKVR